MVRPGTLVPLVVLLLTGACRSDPPAPLARPAHPAPPDPHIPRPAPVGTLAAPLAEAITEARGLVGPTGTLGVEVYRKRRRALLDKLKDSPAFIDGGWDDEHARVSSSFYYLTGVEERGASLALVPRSRNAPEVLYLKSRDVEVERWDGDRSPLPSRALELATGIAHLSRDSAVGGALTRACATSGSLAYVGDLVPPAQPVPRELKLFRDISERTPECRVKSLLGEIGRMRLAKEPEELALMRKAIEITGAGHATALGAVKPGVTEADVKLAIEDAFRHAGARHFAFESITGSGPNSAVLHYPKDDRAMKDGELIVIDIGAETEHYAADVTRTLPVGGKYSAEQRQIYELVLKAQAAGIAAAHVGVTIEEVDMAVRKVIEEGGYYDYFIHGCCHTVGLDVHDSGGRTDPLPANSVITVEPGIYLPQRGFGVRIEDEILITATGVEVITSAIPKDPDELERLMAEKKKAP